MEISESRKPSIPVTAFLPDYEKLMMHVILTSAQFALKDPATVSDLTQLRAHTTWLLGLMDALSTDDYAWSDKVRQRGATGRGGALVHGGGAWISRSKLGARAPCTSAMHLCASQHRHKPRPSIAYCTSSMIRLLLKGILGFVIP